MGIFPFYSIYSFYSPYPHYVMLCLAQDDNRNIVGYIFVTRNAREYSISIPQIRQTLCVTNYAVF